MITKETVLKISHLARLDLTDEEVAMYTQQLGTTFKNFEQIANLDTSNIEPLVTPIEITPRLRDDVVVKGPSVEAILSNAAEKSGNLFKVPPVV